MVIPVSGRVLSVGLLVLLATARGAAQTPAFDLARLVERASSLQAPHVVELTVDDAIERALDRNLDIAVERLNPQLQDVSIAEASAAFLPNLSSSFDIGRSLSPPDPSSTAPGACSSGRSTRKRVPLASA